MANKQQVNFNVPSLMAVFGLMELRKMNKPFPFVNPQTKEEKTTTKVKVLCDSDDEKSLDDDTAEFLEITLEGEVSKDLFKKGQMVDFINARINVRSSAKKGYQDRIDSWLDVVIRAEKMVVYDPATGEFTELGIESIKPIVESKPEQVAAESNKQKKQ